LTWFTATAAGSVLAPAWYVELAAVPALLAIAYQSRRAARTRARLPADTLEVSR
jgi:phage major head subunit gpT-like protein